MASWEDEDFESPDIGTAKVPDRWEGEDEDNDDVKDNWEDDDEENKEPEQAKLSVEKKKKKPLAERLKEKEEAKKQKKKELEESLKAAEEQEDPDMTPEERLAEKIRKQKLIEEADLRIAKETFGISDDVPPVKTIDSFEPSNKDEFAEFQKMLAEKITKYESRAEYAVFLEGLCRDVCAGMDADDIKRISSTLNLLASEKIKVTKAGKSKKKSGKKPVASVKAGKRDDILDYDNQFDDFDDFM